MWRLPACFCLLGEIGRLLSAVKRKEEIEAGEEKQSLSKEIVVTLLMQSGDMKTD